MRHYTKKDIEKYLGYGDTVLSSQNVENVDLIYQGGAALKFGIDYTQMSMILKIKGIKISKGALTKLIGRQFRDLTTLYNKHADDEDMKRKLDALILGAICELGKISQDDMKVMKDIQDYQANDSLENPFTSFFAAK